MKKQPIKWDDEEEEVSEIPSTIENENVNITSISYIVKVQRWNWILQLFCWTLPQMITGIIISGIYFKDCPRLSIFTLSYSLFSLLEPFFYLYPFCQNNFTLWIGRIFGTLGNITKILLLVWGSIWVYSKNNCELSVIYYFDIVLLSLGYLHVCCCYLCNSVGMFFKDTRKKLDETTPLYEEERAIYYKKYMV